MTRQTQTLLECSLDLDEVLRTGESLDDVPGTPGPLGTGGLRTPDVVPGLRRLAGSPVTVASTTFVGALAAAACVAVLVATGASHPAPAGAVPSRSGAVTGSDVAPASAGDARTGLSADSGTRRSAASPVLRGPSTGDARRGLAPDADVLRSGARPAPASPDSADSATRRAAATRRTSQD